MSVDQDEQGRTIYPRMFSASSIPLPSPPGIRKLTRLHQVIGQPCSIGLQRLQGVTGCLSMTEGFLMSMKCVRQRRVNYWRHLRSAAVPRKEERAWGGERASCESQAHAARTRTYGRQCALPCAAIASILYVARLVSREAINRLRPRHGHCVRTCVLS